MLTNFYFWIILHFTSFWLAFSSSTDGRTDQLLQTIISRDTRGVAPRSPQIDKMAGLILQAEKVNPVRLAGTLRCGTTALYAEQYSRVLSL